MKSKKTDLVVAGPMAELAAQGQEGIPGMLEFIKAKIKSITKGGEKVESTKGKRLPGFSDIASIAKVSTLIQAY